MRKTIVDISRVANVSKATVDRVLNDRPNVGEKTRRRVLEVAANMGYALKGVPIHAPGVVTDVIDVILPAGTNAYLKNLQKELHEQARMRTGCELRAHLIEGFNATSLAESISSLVSRSTTIALVGIDHPAVRESIRDAAEAGITVVTLVSDIHDVPRERYVGLDNRAAGRLAGLIMGRLTPQQTPSQIGMIAGSRLYRAHEEREAGFRSILSEQFPYLTPLNPIEVQDDFAIAAEMTRQLILENQNVSGIYSIGAGNRGVAEALKSLHMAQSTTVIVHELTKFSREYLLDGTFDMVLDQNPQEEAALTIDTLLGRTHDTKFRGFIEPKIYFRENIPLQR